MSQDIIDELRSIHQGTRMVGWDFSVLEDHLVSDEPWWDFESDCLAAMRAASSVVDLGTGGGERLECLIGEMDEAETQSCTIAATEGWEPNVPEARKNLAPFGVVVHRYDPENDQTLPFDDEAVDLVMSRHEGITVPEISRVLSPGGQLLTQQVDARDAEEIHDWFDADYLYPEVTAAHFTAEMEAAGLRIDAVDEWTGTMQFSDVQALVMYLGLVPWDVPNFTVDDYSDRLRELAACSPIRVTQRRFRVYASKPEGVESR